MGTQTDFEVARAARLPDAGAAREALASLAPRVHRWVFRYLGPGPDLDDAVQQALIEIAVALDHFDGRASLSTYAHRIALRAASRYRKRARRARGTSLELVSAPVDEQDPERLAMHRESLRRLYRALDELADAQRNAFVLCSMERLPHAEAAAIEGVSVDTLRTRLKRARAALAGRLRDDPIVGPLFGKDRDA